MGRHYKREDDEFEKTNHAILVEIYFASEIISNLASFKIDTSMTRIAKPGLEK